MNELLRDHLMESRKFLREDLARAQDELDQQIRARDQGQEIIVRKKRLVDKMQSTLDAIELELLLPPPAITKSDPWVAFNSDRKTAREKVLKKK